MALIAAPRQADARMGRLPDLSGMENNAICNQLFHIVFVPVAGLFSKRRDNKVQCRESWLSANQTPPASPTPSHENKDASAKCL